MAQALKLYFGRIKLVIDFGHHEGGEVVECVR
jgi:hypothetical protein